MKKNEIVLWGHRFVDDDIPKARGFIPHSHYNNDGSVKYVTVDLLDHDENKFKTIKEIENGKE